MKPCRPQGLTGRQVVAACRGVLFVIGTVEKATGSFEGGMYFLVQSMALSATGVWKLALSVKER